MAPCQDQLTFGELFAKHRAQFPLFLERTNLVARSSQEHIQKGVMKHGSATNASPTRAKGTCRKL